MSATRCLGSDGQISVQWSPKKEITLVAWELNNNLLPGRRNNVRQPNFNSDEQLQSYGSQ